MIRRVCQDKEAQIKDLSYACLKHLEPVTAPLVLISSLPFSGGHYLNQFFDGHPQIMALPDDMMIGLSLKCFHPTFNQNKTPQQLLESISHEAYSLKSAPFDEQGKKVHCTSPFVYLPHLQRLLFIKALDAKEAIKIRYIIEAHLTSIFGAWLNYQKTGPDQKYVAAFVPGEGADELNISHYFDIYPDGKMIFLIMSPEHWVTQTLMNETERYKEITDSLDCWEKYVLAVLTTQRKHQNRVRIIDLKDLATNAEAVMRYLSGFLGIDYHDILLKPTFNLSPVASCREAGTEGPGTSGDENLASFSISEDQRKVIAEMTNEVYQEVLHQLTVI